MTARIRILPRLRVLSGDEIALGPGKVELLEGIDRSGSIAEAARELEMSYTRAWKLVRTMNACFTEPLVESVRGGSARGGARLTDAGALVVDIYRAMEKKSAAAMARDAARLRRMLR